MWEHISYDDNSSVLRNQFTAYLGIALQRRKNLYLSSRTRLMQYETLMESHMYNTATSIEPDMINDLPLLDQLEDIKLKQALMNVKARDLYIFLARALDGKTLIEIAKEIGIRYSTTTSVYYRVRKQLVDEMGGESYRLFGSDASRERER